MANASAPRDASPPRSDRPGNKSRLSNFKEYIEGVREELRKATWPTRAQLFRLTQVVLAVIAVVAVYVGGIDYLLAMITERIGYGAGR